ncbi:SCO4225 family membrane protein [Streptomyces erythrochromogenes]|uniref:SCO4225 family membrane protein n=1 Tax=Streptomyces erythrochromogenes TaxID=285574 RepID=UPI003811E8D7
MTTRTRTLARLTFANPASAIYLGLVGVAIAVATAVTLFAEDPGFVWVLPALCAFPLFMLVPLVHGDGQPATWIFIAELVVCVLVQSLVLGTIVEASRGRLRQRPRPAGPGPS